MIRYLLAVAATALAGVFGYLVAPADANDPECDAVNLPCVDPFDGPYFGYCCYPGDNGEARPFDSDEHDEPNVAPRQYMLCGHLYPEHPTLGGCPDRGFTPAPYGGHDCGEHMRDPRCTTPDASS